MQREFWLLRMQVALGFLALIYYFSWWFVDGRMRSPWLVMILACAVAYAGMQIAGNWLLYLFADRTTVPAKTPEQLTVDVFVAAYREPYDMIERTLAAACAIRGTHSTWLLDDGNDPLLAEMAKRLGAGYLTREDREHAKAGNLNAALARTKGDIIAILDIDHVPSQDFLERSLGHFNDAEMGFVQVMLTFGNGEDSWVAQAAIETSLEFYNPTSLGADGLGGATLMGSNALIRRKALESIGGYQPGLAEDLATSLNLHAAGWKSAYVAEPLAPGHAPPSFTAWFVQQLKWARGVFELLITAYPRLFGRLSWGQRLSYAVRMTKYWIGPVIFAHLSATIAILIFAGFEVRGAFHSYLIHIAPLAFADVFIRHVSFPHLQTPKHAQDFPGAAVALVYGTWPIYLLAWVMAVLRLPLGFHATPKGRSGRISPAWLLPQIFTLALLVLGVLYTVLVGRHSISVLLSFAVAQAMLQLIFLRRWLYSGEFSLAPRAVKQISAPVKVLDLDLEHIPPLLNNLERYRSVLLILRINGQPAFQTRLPVRDGGLRRATIYQALAEEADLSFWQTWLEDYLEWQPERKIGRLPQTATIAVCSRDRPEDLEHCLQALQQLPNQGQEILVVDSASAGEATREVVLRFPRVRYVREDLPGLDRARNRALRESRGEIVIFTDDDAMPEPGWLCAIWENFSDPHVLGVTGLTLPYELETESQALFEQYSPFNRGFRRRVLDKDRLHPLAAGHVGAGVNFALRRSVLQQIGPFNEALDAGTPTLSGGDTEMFARILSRGYKIVYEPAAVAWHRHRRSHKELLAAIYGYGVGTYAYWTQKLLEEGEWSVLILAFQWAFKNQIPTLARSLLGLSGGVPPTIPLAELRGCLAGPSAYLKSRTLLNSG